MKIRNSWIAFFGVIGAAIIAGLFGLFSEKNPKAQGQINQKIDSSGSGLAANTINQSGTGNAIAARDANVTNYFGDTSHSKKKAGDTYNITSKGQSGGITAAKVNINNYVTNIVPDDKTISELPNNYNVAIDTITQIITVQPIAGSWNEPFLAIPYSEKSQVQPYFLNQERNSLPIVKDSMEFQGENLFYMASKGTPSTKDFYYALHYVKKPTYLIFGSYPKPLFKIVFSH